MTEKQVCKQCKKIFEYLTTKRKNASFCDKVCMIGFMKKPFNEIKVIEKPKGIWQTLKELFV